MNSCAVILLKLNIILYVLFVNILKTQIQESDLVSLKIQPIEKPDYRSYLVQAPSHRKY